MRRALHMSPNAYQSINENQANKAIWLELSKNYDEYHILARSADNHAHEYSEGKLRLHLIPGFWRPLSFFFSSYFGLRKLQDRYHFDVLICQCSILGGFWAARNKKKTPVLMEIHDIFYFSYLNGNDIKSRLLKPIIRYSFEYATAARTLNEQMTERLRLRGIKQNRIVEVYNRVDVNLFKQGRESYQLHSPIRLISIGTFVERKGHRVLFEAMKLIKEQYPVELYLIGGGTLWGEYERYIEEHQLSVHLAERCTQEEMLCYMREADIYVHSAWREGMPRTILEAMAMKLPIVATDAGFTSGTVHDRENGLLVETRNPEKLAEAIQAMIEDEKLRRTLAEKAYEDIMEKYEWEKCFSRYRQLIAAVEGVEEFPG